MNMEVTVSHTILLRLGWTLLHFVWQGVTIWLVALVALRALRYRSAESRYVLLMVMLGAMAVMPVMTFGMLGESADRDGVVRRAVSGEPFRARGPSGGDSLGGIPPADDAAPPWTATAEKASQGPAVPLDVLATAPPQASRNDAWFGRFRDWWDAARARTLAALPVLVCLWAAGVVLLALRMAGGWWKVHRVVTRQVEPLESQALLMAQRLAERLRVPRPVRFLESAAAVVPMTVGWLRPVILLPASVLTNLSVAELQCLIAHELVHIRRHDYLVNLLQCILEVLLFYHPAVYWVSRQMRNQRELICDELAVNVTGDRLAYSRALLSAAQLACRPTPLALAASGGDLKARIQAIMLGNNEAQPKSIGIASICLTFVLGGVVYLASTLDVPSTPMAHAQEQPADSQPASSQPAVAGIPAKTATNFHVTDEILPGSTLTPVALFHSSAAKFRLQPIRGRVVDGSGKAIVGAKVYLRMNVPGITSSSRQPVATADLAVVTSSGDGGFRFGDVPASADDLRVDVVAMAPGYALAWKHLPGGMAHDDVKLVMEPAQRIHGRVLDENGQPVASADVQLQYVMSIRHVTQADLEQGRWPRSDDPNYVNLAGCAEAPRGRTDDQGQFAIDGLPADRGHVLLVRHPGYKLSQAYAATVDQIDQENASRAKRLVQTDDMRVSLEKARRLNVEVVYDDTGEPAGGARYADPLNQVFGIPRFAADEDGKFKLSSLVGRQIPVQVFPPEGSDYLAVWDRVEFAENEYEKTHVVRLPRGAVVSGKVVDVETGEGIQGVAVSFVPSRFPESARLGIHMPSAYSAESDTDGAFRLVTPPGQVTVVRTIGNAAGYHTTASEAVKDDSNVQFEQTVQATLEKPVTDAVLRLPRATVVQGIVYDDQGQAAPGVVITGEFLMGPSSTRPFSLESDSEGRFVLAELWETSEYASKLSLPIAVVFHDRSRGLAARMLLEAPKSPADANETLEVHLQPVGSVTGRFVHADTGRPVSGVRVSIYRPVGTASGHWRSATSEIRSDSDGRFRIAGVLGGVGHLLNVVDGRFREINGLNYQFEGQYGQTHDFGDIKLSPPEPPAEAQLSPVSAPAIDGLGAEQAYERLVQKYEEDQAAYRELYQASERGRMQTHVVERREPTPVYAEALLMLADQYPGTEVELRALVWVANCPLIYGSEKRVLALKRKAAQRLLDAYADRKELAPCVETLLSLGGQMNPLGNYSHESAVAIARRLLEENSDREVQAWTCLGIARQLVAVHARPTDDNRKLAIEFLKRVIEQYSDIAYGSEDTMGAIAERDLYELEHLMPGAVAPEIVGVDVDGKELRLSEFRGKIVVLNFWGSWCGPCIHKLEELRTIGEQFGDDVVVLGVMTDSPENARQAIEQHQVRFPNVVDGPEHGPIASQWNVNRWPTTYVLDQHGVIQWRGAEGGSITDAVWQVQRSK